MTIISNHLALMIPKASGLFGQLHSCWSLKRSKLFLILIICSFVGLALFIKPLHYKDNIIASIRYMKTNTQCKPTMKVAFMKTHKCATSIIGNIIYRHAYRQGLNVVIPKKGTQLSERELFKRNATSDAPWGQLEMDVFTLHSRWDYEEVIGLMGPSTFTFSIVRQPVDLFESLYSFSQLNVTFGVDLKGFIGLLRDSNNNSSILKKRKGGFLGRNQIAWDWGIEPRDYDSPHFSEAIQQRIAKLDREFKLVMIAERLDESLVLLADLLCWPLDWVSHLDLNVRKQELKVQSQQQLSEEDRQILSDYLSLDIQLYRYFYQRFEEHLLYFDSVERGRMDRQVRLLQQANIKVNQQCVVQKNVNNEELKGKFHLPNNAVTGYVINETIPGCELFGWSHVAYLDYFKKEMTQRVHR